MAKANLELPNGTIVKLEGTPEEVGKLLEQFGQGTVAHRSKSQSKTNRKKGLPRQSSKSSQKSTDRPDLNRIVTLVKDCDEADKIETQILDRTVQVDRTLLPLYVVHEHLGNAFGLTSGEVSKITTDLGIPISQPNASRIFSGSGARYVIGDKVKKKGQAVRYKLSRRGIKYLKEVLAGDN